MIGIDEAGRGSLAGSMYLVGVKILDNKIIQNCFLLKDSKKLTKNQRNKIFKYLKENKNMLDVKILKFSADKIDLKGLSDIYKEGLEKIYRYFKNKYPNETILFDGNTIYGLKLDIKTTTKAEDKYKEVAIASIIAKVIRDQEIEEIAKKYPEYLWEKHNGYPQNIHKQKIKELGYIEGIHRKSWKI